MDSGYFNNENFREYSYFAGEFCGLETGIPGGPAPRAVRLDTRSNPSQGGGTRAAYDSAVLV